MINHMIWKIKRDIQKKNKIKNKNKYMNIITLMLGNSIYIVVMCHK